MLHIIKLAVGIEDIEHLVAVQRRRLEEPLRKQIKSKRLWHRTRHTPRRTAELLDGGSMYWVIKGRISVRQRLLGFEMDTDEEGRNVCKILLDAKIVLTASRRHRPFQGWRYLADADAPPDQITCEGGDEFPPKLLAELRELGLI